MSENLNNKAALAKKLLKIMQDIGTVPKNGWNNFQKYKYTTETDILEAVKKALLKHNVVVLTSSNNQTKDGEITLISLTHTFIDADTGETLTVNSEGQGHDKLDKGVYKAYTGAMKYFFSKTFLIASDDDPENDSLTTKDTTSTKTATKRATTAPKPPTATTSTNSTPSTGGGVVKRKSTIKRAAPKVVSGGKQEEQLPDWLREEQA